MVHLFALGMVFGSLTSIYVRVGLLNILQEQMLHTIGREPWSSGRDSRSKGCGFESLHRILDGHCFTNIFCKKCNDVCLKRPKINEKEAGVYKNTPHTVRFRGSIVLDGHLLYLSSAVWIQTSANLIGLLFYYLWAVLKRWLNTKRGRECIYFDVTIHF